MNIIPVLINSLKNYVALFVVILIYFWGSISFAQSSFKDIELTSIDFKGNKEFSNSDLKSIIQSKESPFWLWKFFNSFSFLGSPPEYFDSTAISVDIVSLKSFYASQGFFQAAISSSYSIDTTSRTAELMYQISEGAAFTYRTTTWHGLEDMDYLNRFTYPYTTMPVGYRFVESQVSNNVNEVLSILKDNGFMLATFDSTIITIDSVQKVTDLNIYFTPGNRYKYNEIRIEKSGLGKNLVSDELIKYATGIQDSQYYSEDEIAKSRLRLARTGIFNTINLRGIVEDTMGNFVPLGIYGDIGTMNDLSPEVFIDNEFNTSNIGIGLSYTRKNFLGDARKLTLSTRGKVNDIQNFSFASESAKDSTVQTQVDLSLLIEQPFFFKRNISASLEAFYKTYNISRVRFENAGGKLRLAVDMPTYTFVNLLNPYLTLDILGYDINLAVNSETFVRTPTSTTSILGSEIGSSTTNDFFYPTSGYNLNQIVELALTGTRTTNKGNYIQDSLGVSEVQNSKTGLYYKLQTTFSQYFTMSRDKRSVLALKLKVGYIQTFVGGDELIPPNQTFFVGGANSVRGWRARQLVPKTQIQFIGVTEPVNDNIRGGTFIIEGSIEHRRKVEPEIGLAVFLDYGNTWNGYKEFQFKQIAVALGWGLRYYSPFAPFRIDFGWKLWDPVNEKTLFKRSFFKSFEFHFGIGEAF
jgi:outer membrane protein insertion porin family